MATTDPAGDESPDESLPEVFWSVARELRQRNRAALAPWAVTPSQFRAVGTLARYGPIRLSDLSSKLHIAPRSATEVVDALQEHGLVRRERDPGDRRATLVELTEEGTDLAERIRATRNSGAEEFFGRLTPADQAELARILGLLRP